MSRIRTDAIDTVNNVKTRRAQLPDKSTAKSTRQTAALPPASPAGMAPHLAGLSRS